MAKSTTVHGPYSPPPGYIELRARCRSHHLSLIGDNGNNGDGDSNHGDYSDHDDHHRSVIYPGILTLAQILNGVRKQQRR